MQKNVKKFVKKCVKGGGQKVSKMPKIAKFAKNVKKWQKNTLFCPKSYLNREKGGVEKHVCTKLCYMSQKLCYTNCVTTCRPRPSSWKVETEPAIPRRHWRLARGWQFWASQGFSGTRSHSCVFFVKKCEKGRGVTLYI